MTDSKRIQELKHKSRRYSIQEGIFATVKSSFGDNFISPLAIAINSSNSMISLYHSIGGLVGPLSQMLSSRLIERYSRKKIVVKAVLFETLMFIPFILIALLYQYNITANLLPLYLLIAYSFYVFFANLAGPAWFSWMGDIVDEKYRGRWFAKRNIIHGFIAIILAISASVFLDYFKTKNWTMFGFVILFALAFLGRMISRQIFKKQYEPKLKLQEGYYFTFLSFIFKAPSNNFGKYTIFRALISFTGAIFGPLLAVYFLRSLEMSYTLYMMVIFSETFFSLIFMSLWGKFADSYGNYKTMALTAIMLPVLPILWIINSSPLYLIFVPALVGGITWAGFNLSAGNFIYDNVTPQKRGLVVSYFNLVNGIGIFLGAGIGAFLIKVINTSLINPIIIIFYIGSFLRMIVVFWWLPKVKETRDTKKFEGENAFKNLILKETKLALIDGTHDILTIKKYLFLK